MTETGIYFKVTPHKASYRYLKRDKIRVPKTTPLNPPRKKEFDRQDSKKSSNCCFFLALCVVLPHPGSMVCFLSIYFYTRKKRLHKADAFVNRQLPILPGRFHPSTFGLWMLNYCVRYGNRWNHSGIITGYMRVFSQNYTEEEMIWLRTF